uniref:PINc domain-containing protein n=1 Tax=Anopheles dirus TaxID=7168 RepID=A0A182NCE3_9DIPT
MSSKRTITAVSRDKPPSVESKIMVASNTSTSVPPANAASATASKPSVLTPISPVAKRLSAPLIAPKPITPSAIKQPKASSSSRRYSAPNKMPVASSSIKVEKTLSTIVKAKSKKDKGLPVSWRNELYGARPGSAQARLDNLRAALQKEVEEQQKAEASTSKPVKCPPERKSAPAEKSTLVLSDVVRSASAIPAVSAVSTIPTVPAVPTLPENLEDNQEMDVDDVEMNSPKTAPSSPVRNETDTMECDNYLEVKQTEAAKDSAKLPVPPTPEKSAEPKSKNEESKHDSQKLKTNYQNGLAAFSNYFFCVIDTSVFIEHYMDFESFLTKKYVERQPILVVPYKVQHELDTVKHKKPQLASSIMPVVKLLHRMLRARDARMKGQHPWDDTVELIPILSPDDSIINCALQVQTVIDVPVVVVSNDYIMLTKALAANLDSCTMEELQKDYNF